MNRRVTFIPRVYVLQFLESGVSSSFPKFGAKEANYSISGKITLSGSVKRGGCVTTLRAPTRDDL